jgi:hypothetical protein
MALNDEVALDPSQWFADLGELATRRLVRVA